MKRSNLLIIDEYRMVATDIINSVLRKFQSAPRHVGFLDKEPYKSMSREERSKYQDRNQEMYLSSAWYKAHESWDRVTDYAEKMADGRKYFVCQLPYQLAIREGLLTPEEVADEMSESSFNEVVWEMEMNALFWGAHLDSYFQYEEIQKNRKLHRAYYPKNVYELVNDNKIRPPIKKPKEIRIISADIATMAGNENDASVYAVARLIPSKDGYERQMMYMEDLVGGHTQTQALRIRELYEDFDCDFIVLDLQNAGIGVYDHLTTEMINSVTGETYRPLSCMNDDRLAERCVFPDAPRVVYSIKGTLELNATIAAIMKDALRKGKIKFPIHEGETKDILTSIRGFNSLDPLVKAELKAPYIQTTLMANEFLNLAQEVTSNGTIRLTEPRSGRKDRYSAISYLNYFAHEYEVSHRQGKKRNTENLTNFFMGRPANINYF